MALSKPREWRGSIRKNGGGKRKVEGNVDGRGARRGLKEAGVATTGRGCTNE